MISREPLSPALLLELKPLILANHEAIGGGKLEPNWDLYDDLDRGGALCVIVARHDGRAVGYVAHLMIDHPLFGERHAQAVAIYLEREHRGMARAMVAEAERLARNAGAVAVTYGVPTERSAWFLKHLGYWPIETTLRKTL